MRSVFKHKFLMTITFLLCIATACKILFFGYDIDEQYAFAMSFRMLKGDFPLLDMWEPHQTSGYLLSLIMLPYFHLIGTTGIVLYSRFVGLFLHCAVIFCFYKSVSGYLEKDYARLVSAILFFSLPKLMFLPEFSNLQIWFLLLTGICFLAYYGKDSRSDRSGKLRYLVLAGFFTALEVLTYPSMILVFLTGLILICRYGLFNGKQLNCKTNSLPKELLCFIAPCIGSATMFMMALLTRIKITELPQYIGFALSDGSHSASVMEKMSLHISSLLTLGKFFFLYGGVTVILYELLKIILRKRKPFSKGFFTPLFLVVTLIGQGCIWVFGKSYPNYPSAEYFFVPVLFLILFFKKKLPAVPAFHFLIVLPLTAFAGILLFSNHPLLVSLPFLGPCVAGVLAYPGMDKRKGIRYLLLFWILVILFGKCFLLRTTGGIHYSFRQPVVRLTAGPASGIITDEKRASHYKSTLETADILPEHSNVFYAGSSADLYLMKDFNICTPSTISSPTFDEKIARYFELHPEKAPAYIVRDSQIPQLSDWLVDYIQINCGDEPVFCDENIMIYKVQ